MISQNHMKKYMAVFLGAATAEEMEKWKARPDREEIEKKGMAAWNKWGTDNAGAIIDNGSPLGKTKQVDKSGVKDTRNEMAAWTIVQAESHEEAARLFENHPHFTIFPGDRVEIMECLPMPTS